jgi:uncharacterized protein (TIGR00369 family)
MTRDPREPTTAGAVHWRRLERLYERAPVNEYFRPTISIRDGEADLSLVVRPDFFHAANAIHGVVYFKLIDDAAFFAVASRVADVFVLTAQLTVNFAKPVSEGRLTAFGRVTSEEGRHFNAEAMILDEAGSMVGRGSGVFVRSKILLAGIPGYADDSAVAEASLGATAPLRSL